MAINTIHVDANLEEEEIDYGNLSKDIFFVAVFVQVLADLSDELWILQSALEQLSRLNIRLVFGFNYGKIGETEERGHDLGLLYKKKMEYFLDSTLR